MGRISTACLLSDVILRNSFIISNFFSCNSGLWSAFLNGGPPAPRPRPRPPPYGIDISNILSVSLHFR